MSLRSVIIGILVGLVVSFTAPTIIFAASDDDEPEPHVVEQHWTGVPLLEPLDSAGTSVIPVDTSAPMQTFINLGELRMPWFIQVAVGLVTLWVLVSGAMIIILGGDQGGRSKWIEHIKWAIIGLIALVFVGAILRFLNASFFT